ncbi:hypothetical protein IMSAG185_00968 [Lachnospiraceae bacterium]|nr:hypothetical protein IMSAG185_00968 [Lachnospiraceae bacterium]
MNDLGNMIIKSVNTILNERLKGLRNCRKIIA